MPETAPIPPVASQPPIVPKPRRNSLTGLPQYDPDQYGRGRTRRTATRPGVDEATLVVDRDGEGKVNNIENEDATLALCFREAVYALSAIGDQPIIENAINGPESGD